MGDPLKQRLLQRGLGQIPTDGLVRLRDHIDAGRPIVVQSSSVALHDARGRAYG